MQLDIQHPDYPSKINNCLKDSETTRYGTRLLEHGLRPG
jgi:hypothetical protein